MPDVDHSFDPTWLLSARDVLLVQGLMTVVVVLGLAFLVVVVRGTYRSWKMRRTLQELDAGSAQETLTESENRVVAAVTVEVREQMRALAQELSEEIQPVLEKVTITSHELHVLSGQVEVQERRVSSLILELHGTRTELHDLAKTLDRATERMLAAVAEISMRRPPRAPSNH